VFNSRSLPVTHAHAHGGHTHGHGHAAPTGGRAFLIGIVLNLSFVFVEAGFGIASHSMALVADAGHNLSDVLGLALAGAAMLVARRRPTKRRTYGMRGTTILASLVNALVLLFVTGGVAWESVLRFASPQPIASKTVIVVALVGVVINGSSALLFLRDKKRDLNARSAYLHLAADAALSFGVAVSGVIMLATGWLWLDPAVSIVLAIIILIGTWSLFKSSFHLAMQGVPEHIDIEGVRAYLAGLPGVSHVHDLHVWAMSTTEVALTAHIVVPYDRCAPRFLNDVAAHLHDAFKIEHATLQIEAPDDDPCALASDHKV
jgi:cobalt-zinc-cadmium efflux system protein